MDGVRPSATQSVSVATTVASVGPYELTKRRPGAQRVTTSAGSASPPEMTVRSAGSPSDGVTASAAGVRLSTVMFASRSSADSVSPGNSRSAGASTSVAPAVSVVKISSTERSKLRLANCSTRLPGPMPYATASWVTRLATLRCSMAVPLGVPVLPEV
ncbi:hypothetical protein COEX109129_39370 [Corallococcus exiguus]